MSQAAVLGAALWSQAATAEEPARVLRVVIDAEPAHLNPLLEPDLWGYRIAHDLICEPLVRHRPALGGRGEGFEGVLAESFSVGSGGEEVAITLRRDARFHDGKAVTAYDVRATLERLASASKTAPRAQGLLADLLRVEVLSVDRLRLQWRRGARPLAALAEVDILPEAALTVAAFSTRNPQARRPVCSGPYRLADWRRGERPVLTLKRAPTYGPRDGAGSIGSAEQRGAPFAGSAEQRGAPFAGSAEQRGAPFAGSAEQRGAPSIDEIRFLVVPDGARALALMRKGEADVLGRLPALYFPEQVDPALLAGRLRSIEVPANQLVLLLWNDRRVSAPVRSAVSLLANRAALIRDLRHGLGQPLRLPPALGGEALADDASGPGQTPQPSLPSLDLGWPRLPGIITAPLQRWLKPARPEPRSALTREQAAAEALLEAAGARRLSPAGMRVLDGRPLRLGLLVPGSSSELSGVARRLVEGSTRLGVPLAPESQDLPTLQLRVRRGEFDAALVAWSWTGAADDTDMLAALLARGGPLALSGAANQELDTAGSAALRGERQRLSTLWREREPLTVLYRPRQVLLLSQQVLPADPPLVGDFLWLRGLRLR